MSIFNKLYRANSELSKNEYKASTILGFSIITITGLVGFLIGISI